MKSSRLFAYLQLMRPANIVTAMADILAGFAVRQAFIVYIFTYMIVGEMKFVEYMWVQYRFNALLLLVSTIGLYGGGVVYNDVFDAKLDAVERPERPIPSGRASFIGAVILGSILLIGGVLCAFSVSDLSGYIAILTAFFALLYNKVGKHQSWGPINMGFCRGLNLFLGTTLPFRGEFGSWGIENPIKSEFLLHFEQYKVLYICLIPIIYIAAITSVSRGEVHGGSKKSFYIPFFLYSIVILSIGTLAFISGIPIWQSLPFLSLFIYLIFPPLIRAYNDPQPRNIGLAVKAGVISLIVMDASIAAVFAGGIYGLIVLALLPLSRFLAKYFAVT
ncbi:UbiA family prenyltransferase [Cytophagaceae bacterium DM2B3-1]|uniref:UbiA family prenyltransferase n=1 Tax=Xanthocytophaga flava TaxID=3048013 RepID=A0ABT7CVT5_9BACT|nr:UbiA family prenyltransferase [Xanthocytophaga flavus]MDJ1497771.1 UbiA family prenyltransferase [Xanthocytophaga flavus]